MNVQAGDLAYIRHPSVQTFWVVSVLHAAPESGDFALPDGHTAVASGPGRWVCESLQRPFNAPLKSGGTRTCRYAVIHDDYLRPLRGEPETDETVTEIIQEITA